ncbi:MAG: tryptophan--tRNA ligase [Candidatus Aureabacteria bacterium]|nr:tryptophan--tRNA ligase [Candidatus Auribacterota bacterium]
MVLKKRVLSGIQPSGRFHLGNYFAMIKKMVEYQNKSELFCFIVDLHALTTVTDGKQLAEYTNEAAVSLLSLGIDPGISHLWVQSDIPEVTELAWILSNITTLGLMERCHSYKDKVAKGIKPNTGLFIYPILMAADILLFQSNLVPVGKDQKQHLEVARDIALKFNSVYGEIFTIPEPLIDEHVAVVPGIDGQKMSKSYGNTIEVFASKDELKRSVMGIVTDSQSVEASKDPDKCNLYNIYKLFVSSEENKKLRKRYTDGGLKYGDVKKELFEIIWDYFKEARQKREDLLKDKGYIDRILKEGADRTREIAVKTLRSVKNAAGLSVRML